MRFTAIVADSLFLGNDDTLFLLPTLVALSYGVAYAYQRCVRLCLDHLLVRPYRWLRRRWAANGSTAAASAPKYGDAGRTELGSERVVDVGSVRLERPRWLTRPTGRWLLLAAAWTALAAFAAVGPFHVAYLVAFASLVAATVHVGALAAPAQVRCWWRRVGTDARRSWRAPPHMHVRRRLPSREWPRPAAPTRRKACALRTSRTWRWWCSPASWRWPTQRRSGLARAAHAAARIP